MLHHFQIHRSKANGGLPYCVGATDGCHIEGTANPTSQLYEYKCFKQFTSIILLAVCDSLSRFLYAVFDFLVFFLIILSMNDQR